MNKVSKPEKEERDGMAFYRKVKLNIRIILNSAFLSKKDFRIKLAIGDLKGGML